MNVINSMSNDIDIPPPDTDLSTINVSQQNLTFITSPFANTYMMKDDGRPQEILYENCNVDNRMIEVLNPIIEPSLKDPELDDNIADDHPVTFEVVETGTK